VKVKEVMIWLRGSYNNMIFVEVSAG